MRPVTRQSARLAIYNSARPQSRAINPKLEQQRTFNTTVPRGQEPRPSNGASDPHVRLNEWREHEKKPESVPPRPEQDAEQEAPELKSANDGRKHGTRRILRQKRIQDVPKPPPIPDWFLKHNVKLYKDFHGRGMSDGGGQVIRCIDTETGHTLFTVPYYDVRPAALPQETHEGRAEVRNELLNGSSGILGYFTSTLERGDEPKHGRTKDDIAVESSPSLQPPQRLLERSDPQRMPPDPDKTPRSAPFDLSKDASQFESKYDQMRWIFLEAEASVRAGLSLANENQRSSSFAADRVDLSLQCPDENSHDQLDAFVQDIARIVQADLVRLDANDFAELTEDYVGHGHDEPGSFSNLGYDVFDGYEAGGHRSMQFRSKVEEDEDNEMDEDEDVEEDEQDDVRGNNLGPLSGIGDLRKMLQDGRIQLGNALNAHVIGIGIGVPQSGRSVSLSSQPPRSRAAPSSQETSRNDARLVALLEQLLDAPKQKRITKDLAFAETSSNRRSDGRQSASYKRSPDNADDDYQHLLRKSRSTPAFWLRETAKSLVGYLGKAAREAHSAGPAITLTSEPSTVVAREASAEDEKARTIIHIRDLQDICSSRLGDTIINRLVKVVRKRRRSGQQIVIVGSTSQDVPGPIPTAGDHVDDFPFRTLVVPPFFNLSVNDDLDIEIHSTPAPQRSIDVSAYGRIMEINLRHIQSMLRRLRPEDHVDLLASEVRGQLNMSGIHFLTEKVLSLDQVQRLVLLAIGLSQSHAQADVVQPIHIALAGLVTTSSDHAAASWAAFKERKQAKKDKPDLNSASAKGSVDGESIEARMQRLKEGRIERLKKICNAHETRLLNGMVDPQNIKTGFADVHAPSETIEALKTVTTLSLLRPEAFKYGVLANDRLPGLLLYGPPGTGKTLLAKAVAKESKATVLEVSGAQIYEKYVGEGEKMVRAVFSLAKKLSPCVVFIDEADAIFGSRGNVGSRNTHREIINQFLREWDGMDDHSVFMMVASNRPFDLDDAVLRRLPRRLLIDLPVAKDRKSILGIHLKGENLDASVSLSQLADQTPFYSGSDLKNLAVAAALACVREENEMADTHKEDKEFKLPDKRTLTSKHFEKALAEISASISEDMSSLSAIRKFDEQFGDRKGRRKKTGYGFGASDGSIDEALVRVRQPVPPTPPPPAPSATPPSA